MASHAALLRLAWQELGLSFPLLLALFLGAMLGLSGDLRALWPVAGFMALGNLLASVYGDVRAGRRAYLRALGGPAFLRLLHANWALRLALLALGFAAALGMGAALSAWGARRL